MKTPEEIEAESQRLYQASLESRAKMESAYLSALAESAAVNLRAAVALERIAALSDLVVAKIAAED